MRRRSLAMAAIRQSLSRLYSISISVGKVLRKGFRVVYVFVRNVYRTCSIFLRCME